MTLAPGLVGNPHATPQCDMGDVEKGTCPEDTAVGVAEVVVATPPHFESANHLPAALIYNIAPYSNEPAAYGFEASNLAVRLDASLPARNAYRLTLSATDLSDAKPLHLRRRHILGVPADHNGPPCKVNQTTMEEECVEYRGSRGGCQGPLLEQSR